MLKTACHSQTSNHFMVCNQSSCLYW